MGRQNFVLSLNSCRNFRFKVLCRKSQVREPIIGNFVGNFSADFSFFRLFEGAPLSVGHAQVIKCPEDPSDPSLKVSATESKSTCFNFAKIANP